MTKILGLKNNRIATMEKIINNGFLRSRNKLIIKISITVFKRNKIFLQFVP